jgi:predicted Fe-Mo cluster-binding NifX family protein
MEKVGITHHLGYVSPVFDVARNLLFVSVQDGQGQVRQETTLETADPFLRAQKIKDLGVDVVVCGAISRVYEMALLQKGIKVVASVCGPIEEVLSAYLDGTLSDFRFLMPGCTGQRRFRGRCGKGRLKKDGE